MHLKEELGYALTDEDIRNLLDDKIKIVPYPDLINYESIDELLEPYDAVALLFEIKPKQGHWVLIHRLPNGHIEFFNSYGGRGGEGGYPDDCLDYVPKRYRKESNQDFPHLTQLLYECPDKIDYNQYQFQSDDPNIKTCGRWVSIRRILNDITLKDFSKIFKKENGDEIVTFLTM